MLFSSQIFVLVFLPITLGLFYAAPTLRARQTLLVVASLVFYGAWDWRFVPALVALTLTVWRVTRAYAATGSRAWLTAGILLNIAVLAFFKYANFLLANLAALAFLPHPQPLGIILPLGISFFTFQKIAYLIDLRRGDRHIYGLLEFFAFVTFFPQLIAGPIVRHSELMPQWSRDPNGAEKWQNIARGLILFIIGFAKKTALADTLAPIADPLFAKPILSLPEAWLAAIAFALQIYFDFSGYSDMAIGLARMFGLDLPINFDAPYRATSIRSLWRRWHMTLSRFLRDYVYIPLGGNRSGNQARNVVLTMLIGGLWHGAAWTFVLWGALQGAALAANGLWARRRLPMPAPLGWLLTTTFFVAAFVFFRAADTPSALRILTAMITPNLGDPIPAKHLLPVALAAAIALIGPTSQQIALDRLRPTTWATLPAGLALVALLLLAGGRIPAEFIYFQF